MIDRQHDLVHVKGQDAHASTTGGPTVPWFSALTCAQLDGQYLRATYIKSQGQIPDGQGRQRGPAHKNVVQARAVGSRCAR
jgi:hypothetical protein